MMKLKARKIRTVRQRQNTEHEEKGEARGSIQEVQYLLNRNAERANQEGKEIIKEITRNRPTELRHECEQMAGAHKEASNE